MEQIEQNIEPASLSNEPINTKKKSKTWLWVAIGCGIFILFSALVVVLASIGFYFYAGSAEKKDTPVVTDDKNQYSSWQLMESTEDKFEAKFPDYPMVEKSDDEYSSSNNYTVEDGNGRLYGIAAIHYKFDLSDEGIGPLEAMSSMLESSPEAELVEADEITYKDESGQDNLMGVEYLIKLNDSLFQRGMVVIIENTIYKITVSYKNDNFSQEDYKYFTANLNLKDSK